MVVGLGWVGLGWVGLGWVGLGWVGFGLGWLGWVGLGWLGWVGLGWVGLIIIFTNRFSKYYDQHSWQLQISIKPVVTSPPQG